MTRPTLENVSALAQIAGVRSRACCAVRDAARHTCASCWVTEDSRCRIALVARLSVRFTGVCSHASVADSVLGGKRASFAVPDVALCADVAALNIAILTGSADTGAGAPAAAGGARDASASDSIVKYTMSRRDRGARVARLSTALKQWCSSLASCACRGISVTSFAIGNGTSLAHSKNALVRVSVVATIDGALIFSTA